MQDHLTRAAQERQRLEDPRPDDRMRLHQRLLGLVERARLLQHRVGHRHLADVVQDEAVGELGVVRVLGDHLTRQQQPEIVNPLDVVPGPVVSLGHHRERSNHRHRSLLELRGPPQLALVAALEVDRVTVELRPRQLLGARLRRRQPRSAAPQAARRPPARCGACASRSSSRRTTASATRSASIS